MNIIKPHAKSILAAVVAFVGATATGYTDDVMTTAEWWSAAATALTALGVVYGVPNRHP